MQVKEVPTFGGTKDVVTNPEPTTSSASKESSLVPVEEEGGKANIKSESPRDVEDEECSDVSHQEQNSQLPVSNETLNQEEDAQERNEEGVEDVEDVSLDNNLVANSAIQVRSDKTVNCQI